ncbi:MAG: carbohydrate-binding domain-containing protein [Treponema sp.]|nr:carbohydrate-binding domain-containing protein [Treponema sp.]
MKKLILILALALITVGAGFAQKVKLDPSKAKKNYKTQFTISPKDSSVIITNDTITFTPKKEGTEYTLSGYFNGQIVNKTKNTVFKLNNAFIENTSGAAAIYGEAKTEISAVKNTVNYLVSMGQSLSKTAALQCKKNLEIGGSGTLYAIGSTYHGVKADDVKIKGSGTFYLQGTQEGSALNCHSVLSEKEKSFKAYFINSKNGIKADNTISISSGTFYFYDNEIALKTDTSKEDPTNKHEIALLGGTIYTHGNSSLYLTEKGAYKVKSAKISED